MTVDETTATAPTKNALAAREIAWAKNTPELLAQHAQVNATADGGTVIRTRFPPEPNGYLHLGHAKSINMNFSLAFDKLQVPLEKRRTVFRYDDTNPDAESQEYIDYDLANETLTKELEDLHWYDKKVFNLIQNEYSITELSKKTTISYHSLYNTFRKVKDRLKEKVK